jgi:hypothetical protein
VTLPAAQAQPQQLGDWAGREWPSKTVFIGCGT